MKIIFLINDHPAHLALLMVHLLRLGYAVLGSNCEGAVKLLDDVRPHLIFFDILTLGSGEIELITQVRQTSSGATIPFLVLADKSISYYAEAVMTAGADALYQHPKDISYLEALLTQYLEN